MTDHSFDKVAVAIEKQGKAFKTFSKRQDERFDDVTKRIEKIETKNALGDFASELRLLRLLRSLSDLPSVFGDSRSHGAA